MVTINIGRNVVIFFGVIILVFAVVGAVIASWDNTKVMFHAAEDVRIASLDKSLEEAISDGNLKGASVASVCEWKDMRTSFNKPGGNDCNVANMAAYVLQSDVESPSDGKISIGFCRYTTTAGYGKVIYGFLETRRDGNSEYDETNRVLVCQNDWYVASVGNSNECAVVRDEIAQYLVCE